ncbi:MAG: glycosyltransferase, partial [Synergistaceae bacterium]|nr:glycosyltransferase [Synergistaceae bacterium]
MMTNKILIFSGGTGGHIIPAIMFGKKLQSENKIVKWVCGSRKLEREIYNALEIQPMLLSLSGSPLGSKSITKIFSRFVDLIKSFFKTS